MTLEIVINLENPKPVYTSGDVLKGKIRLRSSGNHRIPVNDLLIQLVCNITTRTHGIRHANLPPSESESISIPYCFIRRLITQSRHVATTEAVPFEFTLPAGSMRNDIEPVWDESAVFENQAGKPLPPSWIDKRHRSASVSHFLEVIMHAGGLFNGYQFTRKLRLKFSPCRTIELPDPRLVRTVCGVNMSVAQTQLSSLTLNDVALRRPRSLIGRLMPSAKRNITLEIHVYHPSVICAGGPISLSVSAHILGLGSASASQRQQQGQQDQNQNQNQDIGDQSQSGIAVTSDLPDSTTTEIPVSPVTFIEGIDVHLKAQTESRIHVVVPHPTWSATLPTSTQEYHHSTSEQVRICNIHDRPIAISTYPAGSRGTTPTQVNQHYPELKLSGDITPSFSGFSLRREHTLNLRLSVLFSGCKETVEIAHPVLILPAIVRDVEGAVEDGGGTTPVLRRQRLQEALPPYQAVDPLGQTSS